MYLLPRFAAARLGLFALTWPGLSFRTLAADYAVTNSGGNIVITDTTDTGLPLILSQPATNTIRFTATGLTFSVNGGANTTGSTDISLTGIQSITVNGRSGYDAITVQSFDSTAFPSLSIIGGNDYDSVNLQGDITFAANRSLVVELQNDDATSDADRITFERDANLILSGTGAATCKAGGTFQMYEGSSIVTEHGNLLVEANQQAIATAGGPDGVFLFTGLLQATGTGSVTVRGRGSNSGPYGVRLHNGGRIAGGTSGLVSVTGIGGSNGGSGNEGILISGGGSAVTSGGGDIVLTGTGGGAGAGGGNTGVHVFDGTVSAGGGGNVTIRGTGGSGAGSYAFYASALDSTIISSNNGAVEITGSPGPANEGFIWIVSGAVVSTGNNQPLTLTADRIFIGNPVSAGRGRVVLRPYTPNRPIVLGQSTADVLDLSDFYLDFITAGTLQIGDNASGPVTVGSAITRPSSTDMHLISAGDVILAGSGSIDTGGGTISLDAGNPPAAVKPQKPGTDLTADTLFINSAVSLRINGSTPDTGYDQLNVAGRVNLTGASLELASPAFPSLVGTSFTLVANDGADPITSRFAGLPEGAFIAWPGNAAFVGRLSYFGDTGNDVVLTLVAPDPGFSIVANTGDSGPGSLRNALTYAAAHSGADTITFSPALAGQTIPLSSPLGIPVGDVTVDASSLPGGLTLEAGRFIVSEGAKLQLSALHLQRNPGTAIQNYGTLTLTRCSISGNADPVFGGAIYNSGNATLTRCTLFGNTGGDGGAIYHNSGTLALEHCTLSGNSADSAGSGAGGGAIFSANGTLTLTHCTISGNSAGHLGGGGIYCGGGSLTLAYCVISENTAIRGPEIRSTVVPLRTGVNFIGRLADSLITAGAGIFTGDAKLAVLDNYGGPTRTMALMPGSPARNAATGSSNPSDQRGLPAIGISDLGAYESGHITNCAAWLWENLPAAASVAQHSNHFDYDGDGATNEQEWNARTNPSDLASCFRITSFVGTGSQHVISFPTVTGRTYTLWRSDDATEWTADPDAPTLNGNGAPQFFTVPAPDVPLSSANGRRFYRIHAGP